MVMCILHNFCLDEGYSIEDVDVPIKTKKLMDLFALDSHGMMEWQRTKNS